MSTPMMRKLLDSKTSRTFINPNPAPTPAEFLLGSSPSESLYPSLSFDEGNISKPQTLHVAIRQVTCALLHGSARRSPRQL